MFRRVAAIGVAALMSSCATVREVPPQARAELAPSGTLRVGINFGNVLLTAKDSTTGEARGVAPDLARELARRLGVPIQIVPFATAGQMADAVHSGAWDVAFLAVEPVRASEIAFSAPYAEIEGSYLVPVGSPLRGVEDVDRPGVRIAVAQKSAYDLYLSRSLKHAQLLRATDGPAAFQRFVDEKLDAYANLKPVLLSFAEKLPGSRVLEGRFTVVGQAIGTPKGRTAAADYLRSFADEVRSSGFVADLIARHGIRGLAVARGVPPN